MHKHFYSLSLSLLHSALSANCGTCSTVKLTQEQCTHALTTSVTHLGFWVLYARLLASPRARQGPIAPLSVRKEKTRDGCALCVLHPKSIKGLDKDVKGCQRRWLITCSPLRICLRSDLTDRQTETPSKEQMARHTHRAQWRPLPKAASRQRWANHLPIFALHPPLLCVRACFGMDATK